MDLGAFTAVAGVAIVCAVVTLVLEELGQGRTAKLVGLVGFGLVMFYAITYCVNMIARIRAVFGV